MTTDHEDRLVDTPLGPKRMTTIVRALGALAEIEPGLEGPRMVWRSAYEAGSCNGCHRDIDEHHRARGQVLEITPRGNGALIYRLCRLCLSELRAAAQ